LRFFLVEFGEHTARVNYLIDIHQEPFDNAVGLRLDFHLGDGLDLAGCTTERVIVPRSTVAIFEGSMAGAAPFSRANPQTRRRGPRPRPPAAPISWISAFLPRDRGRLRLRPGGGLMSRQHS
jgi:hypothetical protein